MKPLTPLSDERFTLGYHEVRAELAMLRIVSFLTTIANCN